MNHGHTPQQQRTRLGMSAASPRTLPAASPLRAKVDAATSRVLEESHIRDEELKRQLKQLLDDCTEAKLGPKERGVPPALLEELSRAHTDAHQRLLNLKSGFQALLAESSTASLKANEEVEQRQMHSSTASLSLSFNSRSPAGGSLVPKSPVVAFGRKATPSTTPTSARQPALLEESSAATSGMIGLMKGSSESGWGDTQHPPTDAIGADPFQESPSDATPISVRRSLARAVGDGIGTLTKNSKLHEVGTSAEHQRLASDTHQPLAVRVDELVRAVDCLQPLDSVLRRLGDMTFSNTNAYQYIASMHGPAEDVGSYFPGTKPAEDFAKDDSGVPPPPPCEGPAGGDEVNEDRGWSLGNYEGGARTASAAPITMTEPPSVVHFKSVGGPSGSAARVAYLERRLMERESQLDFLRGKLNRRSEILAHIRSTLLKEQLVLKARQLGPYEIPGFSFFNIVDVVENAEEFEVATSTLRDEFDRAKRAQEKLIDQLQSDGASKRFEMIKSHDEEMERLRQQAAHTQARLEEEARAANQRADDVQKAAQEEVRLVLEQMTALHKEAKDQTRRINHLMRKNQQLEGKKSSSIGTADPSFASGGRRGTFDMGGSMSVPSIFGDEGGRKRVASMASVVFSNKSPSRTNSASPNTRLSVGGGGDVEKSADAMIVSHSSFSIGDTASEGQSSGQASPKRNASPTGKSRTSIGGGSANSNAHTKPDKLLSPSAATTGNDHTFLEGEDDDASPYSYMRHPVRGPLRVEDKSVQVDVSFGGSFMGMPPLHPLSRAPSGFTMAPTPSERSLVRSVSPGGYSGSAMPGGFGAHIHHGADYEGGEPTRDASPHYELSAAGSDDPMRKSPSPILHGIEGDPPASPEEGATGGIEPGSALESAVEEDGGSLDPATTHLMDPSIGLLDMESLPDEVLSRVGSFLGDTAAYKGLEGILSETMEGGPLGSDGNPLAAQPTLCFTGLMLSSTDAAEVLVNDVNHAPGGQCIVRPFTLSKPVTDPSVAASDLGPSALFETYIVGNSPQVVVYLLATFQSVEQATNFLCTPKEGLLCAAVLRPSSYELRAYADADGEASGLLDNGSASSMSRADCGAGDTSSFSVMTTSVRMERDLPSFLNTALTLALREGRVVVGWESSELPIGALFFNSDGTVQTPVAALPNAPKELRVISPSGARILPAVFATSSQQISLPDFSKVDGPRTLTTLAKVHTEILELAPALTMSAASIHAIMSGAVNFIERDAFSHETVFVTQLRAVPEVSGHMSDAPEESAQSRATTMNTRCASIEWSVLEAARRDAYLCTANHSHLVSVHLSADDAAQYALACYQNHRRTVERHCERATSSLASVSSSPRHFPESSEADLRPKMELYVAVGACTLSELMAGVAFEGSAGIGGCAFTPKWGLHEPFFNAAPNGVSNGDLLHRGIAVAAFSSKGTLTTNGLGQIQQATVLEAARRGLTSSSPNKVSSCFSPVAERLARAGVQAAVLMFVEDISSAVGGQQGLLSKRELSMQSMDAGGGNFLAGTSSLFIKSFKGKGMQTGRERVAASTATPASPAWSLVPLSAEPSRQAPFNWKPFAVGPRVASKMFLSVTVVQGVADAVMFEHFIRDALVAESRPHNESSSVDCLFTVTALAVDDPEDGGNRRCLVVALCSSREHLVRSHVAVLSTLELLNTATGLPGQEEGEGFPPRMPLSPLTYFSASELPFRLYPGDMGCATGTHAALQDASSLPTLLQAQCALQPSVWRCLSNLSSLLRGQTGARAAFLSGPSGVASAAVILADCKSLQPFNLPSSSVCARQLPGTYTFIIGGAPSPNHTAQTHDAVFQLAPLPTRQQMQAYRPPVISETGAIVVSAVCPLVASHGWQALGDVLAASLANSGIASPGFVVLPSSRLIGEDATPLVTLLLPVRTLISLGWNSDGVLGLLRDMRAVCGCVDFVGGCQVPYLCESVEALAGLSNASPHYSYCLTSVATTNVLTLRLTKWVSMSRTSNVAFTDRAVTWLNGNLAGNGLSLHAVGVNSGSNQSPCLHNLFSRPSRLQQLDRGGSYEVALHSTERIPPEVTVSGLISSLSTLHGLDEFLCDDELLRMVALAIVRSPHSNGAAVLRVSAVKTTSRQSATFPLDTLPTDSVVLAPHPELSAELSASGVIFFCQPMDSPSVEETATGFTLLNTCTLSAEQCRLLVVGSPESGFFAHPDSIPCIAATNAVLGPAAPKVRLPPGRMGLVAPTGSPSSPKVALTAAGRHPITVVGLRLRHPNRADCQRFFSTAFRLISLYGGVVFDEGNQEVADASALPVDDDRIILVAFATVLDAFEFAVDVANRLRNASQAHSSLNAGVQKNVLRLITVSLASDAVFTWDYLGSCLRADIGYASALIHELRAVQDVYVEVGRGVNQNVEDPVMLVPSSLFHTIPQGRRRGTVSADVQFVGRDSLALNHVDAASVSGGDEAAADKIVSVFRAIQTKPASALVARLRQNTGTAAASSTWEVTPFVRTLIQPSMATFLLPSPAAVGELRSLVSSCLALYNGSSCEDAVLDVFEVLPHTVMPPPNLQPKGAPVFTITLVVDLCGSTSIPNANRHSYFSRKADPSLAAGPLLFCESLLSCACRFNRIGYGAILSPAVDPTVAVHSMLLKPGAALGHDRISSMVTLEPGALLSHRAFVSLFVSPGNPLFRNPVAPLLVRLPSHTSSPGSNALFPHAVAVDESSVMVGPVLGGSRGAAALVGYFRDAGSWSAWVPVAASVVGTAAFSFAPLLRMGIASQECVFTDRSLTEWTRGRVVVLMAKGDHYLDGLLAHIYAALEAAKDRLDAVPLASDVCRGVLQQPLLLLCRGKRASEAEAGPEFVPLDPIRDALQLFGEHFSQQIGPGVVSVLVSAPFDRWEWDAPEWRSIAPTGASTPTLQGIPGVPDSLISIVRQRLLEDGNASMTGSPLEQKTIFICEEEPSLQSVLPSVTGRTATSLHNGLREVMFGAKDATGAVDGPWAIGRPSVPIESLEQELREAIVSRHHVIDFRLSSASSTKGAQSVVSSLLYSLRVVSGTASTVILQRAIDASTLRWTIREPPQSHKGSLQCSSLSTRAAAIVAACRVNARIVVTHKEARPDHWLDCLPMGDTRGASSVRLLPTLHEELPNAVIGLVTPTPELYDWLREAVRRTGDNQLLLSVRARVPGVVSVLELRVETAAGSSTDAALRLLATLPQGILLSYLHGQPSGQGWPGSSLLVAGSGRAVGSQTSRWEGVHVGVQWEDPQSINWGSPACAENVDGVSTGSGVLSGKLTLVPRAPAGKPGESFTLNGGARGPAQITMHVCTTTEDPDEFDTVFQSGNSSKRRNVTSSTGVGRPVSSTQVALDGTWHLAPKVPKLPNHDYAKGYVRVANLPGST